MVTDSISNLIISLKNASKAGLDYANVPANKMNASVLQVLKDNNFIESFKNKDEREIRVDLKYTDGMPAISDVKRISKNSKRVYKGSKEIKRVKQGYGMAVITTPQGVVSDKEAREKNIGGEVLFEIW